MVLKKVFAALLLIGAAIGCYSSNEWNDSLIGYVAHRGNEVVLAYKSIPCAEKILKTIPKKHRVGFAKATIMDSNGVIEGCWAAHEDKAIFVWEDGSKGWMFQHEFRLLRGT